MPSTAENVNNSPEQFRLIEEKCAALEKKVSDLEDKNIALQSNVFSLNRFSSDEVMLFYTGFPNYKAFLATFEYLNPGNTVEPPVSGHPRDQG